MPVPTFRESPVSMEAYPDRSRVRTSAPGRGQYDSNGRPVCTAR